MIRNREELRSAVAEVIVLAVQLLVFAGLRWLSDIVKGDDWGLWWDIISTIVTITVAALIPSLVWASPEITTTWIVDGSPSSGTAVVDLRNRSKRKFTFRVELHTKARSLLALAVLRRMAKKNHALLVTFEPPSTVRLSVQTPTGGATKENEAVRLPVNHNNQDVHQSSFYGSIRTSPGGYTYEVAIHSMFTEGAGWFIRRYVKVRDETRIIRLLE